MEEEYIIPTIPAVILMEIIKVSAKCQGELRVGTTVNIILKGTKFIGKRSLSFRDDVDEVDYEQAVGMAFKANVISAVMDWFTENRNYKEGGYFVPQQEK